MNINGLQKLTLLDFPGRVACTVFLAGCPFRCPFCHNSELLSRNAETVMDDKELLQFLEKRKNLLDGVAVTGGEPLMTDEIFPLLRSIRQLGYAVKLDTNGAYPQRLQRIVEEGLADYIAMDIKNSPQRYAETIGLNSFDLTPIRESVALLMEKAPDYEFRTTVVEELHDDNSFREIGEWIRGAKRYFIQPFIDRDTVLAEGLHAPAAVKLKNYAEIIGQYVGSVGIRGTDIP